MNNSSVIKKYARALYNVAVQQENAKEVSNRINYIVKAMKVVPEFRQALQTHKLPIENKTLLLNNVLQENISELELELISDILEHSNILILPEIVRHFDYLVETNSSVLNMTITSALELSTEEIEHIKSKVESQLDKKIDVKTELDPSLIGGIRLRIGNMVIDNTISRRLDLLRKSLTQA